MLSVNTAFGKRTGFLPDTEAVDADYLYGVRRPHGVQAVFPEPASSRRPG